MLRSNALAIVIILCSFGGSGAQNVSNLKPLQKFEIEGSLTDDNDDVSTNVSGVACMQPIAGRHNCVVIDDESRAAQLVTIEGRRLIAGAKVPLIGDEPSASITGQEPKNAGCSAGKGKFKKPGRGRRRLCFSVFLRSRLARLFPQQQQVSSVVVHPCPFPRRSTGTRCR